MTPEFATNIVERVTNRSPYRCSFGTAEQHDAYFATFADALTFARSMRAAWDGDPYYSISIYNDATRDLEPGGSNPTGLTDEEHAQWSE
jgi:hypothetical protein